MPALEALKRTFERVTGFAKPAPQRAVRARKAWTSWFKDDGVIPNNPDLPFIHYLGAVRLDDASDPAAVFETLFEQNGWSGAWRNGIYDYVHYHPRTHEVLGIARGRARVRFGGRNGKIVRVKAGDVVILPAGTGHQALSATRNLLVVGAYPPSGTYDEFRESPKEHARAERWIPEVELPKNDPVYGVNGPLKRLWRF
ncbi:MAG TPA: cupin domain-containing protein [Xanthobacteraceae bacterium]|nr:cupin domain-containing protein [Xanthobacteraceae bacterium]